MDTLSDVVMAGNDDSLQRLLSAWVDAVKRYDRLFDGIDCCWWYNERANISVLAGAAWTLPGWAALEEYSSEKTARKKSGLDEGSARGRVDLYISTEDEGLAFEAKHAWQDITGSSLLSAVNAGRTEAKRDTERLLYQEANRFFAATFAVPLLPPHTQGRERLVRCWLDHLADELSTSYAYVFPRLKHDHFINKNKYAYPGVVLIVEEIDKVKPAAQTAES